MMSNKLTNSYTKSFVIAIAIHLVLLLFLVLSFHAKTPKPIVNKSHKIVHAVAVNNTQVQKLVKQLKQQEQDKAAAEKAHQQQLAKLAKQAKQQRLSEQKRVTALKQQQAAMNKKIKQQKAKEQAALAKLKQQQNLQQKQLKTLEQQQQAAQQKLAQLKQKNADATKQREQYQAALALQKQIAAKQAAIAQQKSQAIDGIIDKYKGLILEAIAQNWLVPPGTNPKLSCQLYIALGKAGKVKEVRVTKTSGNQLLDRSAVAAVYKASPLPIPSNQSAYSAFEQFNLTVTPENIITVES